MKILRNEHTILILNDKALQFEHEKKKYDIRAYISDQMFCSSHCWCQTICHSSLEYDVTFT